MEEAIGARICNDREIDELKIRLEREKIITEDLRFQRRAVEIERDVLQKECNKLMITDRERKARMDELVDHNSKLVMRVSILEDEDVQSKIKITRLEANVERLEKKLEKTQAALH